MDTIPYTIEQIAPKQVILNADPTVIWSFRQNSDVTPLVWPTGHSLIDTTTTIEEILHHTNGKDYYLLQGRLEGYDVVDCEDVIHEPEPVQKSYTAPAGGLKISLHREPYRVIAKSIPGYDFPTFAAAGKNKVIDLHLGTYSRTITDTTGMIRLDKGDGTNAYWINPADNVEAVEETQVEQPALEVADAENPPQPTPTHFPTVPQIRWYSEPMRFKADQGYMIDHKFDVVYQFGEGQGTKNAYIERNQPIWIAGTFGHEDDSYGVPAMLLTTGKFKTFPKYGIRMSNLSMMQVQIETSDLEPEEIEDVTDEIYAQENPKQLTIADQIQYHKLNTIRKIRDFL